MRSMCVGVAETGVNPFLFLSFSFFSDKRKEHYKKLFFMFLFRSIEINTYAEHVCFHYPKTSP